MQKTEITKVYETVLSAPGMNEMVKIDLRLSRKNVFLLSKVIERGLSFKEDDADVPAIFEITAKENLEELASASGDLLEKAGLTEMSRKLASF